MKELDSNVEPVFNSSPETKSTSILSKIFRKNKLLEKTGFNSYASERLHLKGIRDDIDTINQRIMNLNQMQVRLKNSQTNSTKLVETE